MAGKRSFIKSAWKNNADSIDDSAQVVVRKSLPNPAFKFENSNYSF